MKVPTVSYGAAAVPETVGASGIVLRQLNPEKLAKAVDIVVSDEATNIAVGMSGWQRYEQNFTNSRIESLFLRGLGWSAERPWRIRQGPSLCGRRIAINGAGHVGAAPT